MTRLKSDGLIKIHYKDKLRGIRLTRRGKDLLLSLSSERFSYYLTDNSETNRPRSDLPRRLRLQQASIAYAMLQCAGIPVYPEEKPALFSGNPQVSAKFAFPLFYTAGNGRSWGQKRSRSTIPDLWESCYARMPCMFSTLPATTRSNGNIGRSLD